MQCYITLHIWYELIERGIVAPVFFKVEGTKWKDNSWSHMSVLT